MDQDLIFKLVEAVGSDAKSVLYLYFIVDLMKTGLALGAIVWVANPFVKALSKVLKEE